MAEIAPPSPASHSKATAERPSSADPIRVALLGNPNTGKSTLFNALTGIYVRIGNYPGVTVEKRVGKTTVSGRRLEVFDLPGAYSLSPHAEDELVAVKAVLGMMNGEPQPDAIVCIANAENLERNLFLVGQCLDIGVPVIVVLNMWDSAKRRGLSIDIPGLTASLGVPVIATEAHRGRGIAELKKAIVSIDGLSDQPRPRPLPKAFYAEARRANEEIAREQPNIPELFVERAILDEEGLIEKEFEARYGEHSIAVVKDARRRLVDQGHSPHDLETTHRYQWSRDICAAHVTAPEGRNKTLTDRIDTILTHRVFGLMVFVTVTFIIFQAIFNWATPMMDGLAVGQEWLIGQVESWLPPGAFRSMLTDSVIAGAGTVLIFVPQIAMLFLFIAILEDSGYMPRVAFMLDRLMSSFGLSGKSFLPLMSSFACAIPGIMATRVIENRRDRLVTILVAPLMSCSARLPVYILLIGAFIPAVSIAGGLVSVQGLVLMAMSSLGALIAIPIAWIFRKSIVQGDQTPFVLELPEYKIPSVKVVLSRVYDRVTAFIVRAGTMILAASVLIWVAAYFPGNHGELNRLDRQIANADSNAPIQPLAEMKQQRDVEAARLLEVSFLGRTGKLIEPAVKPLGWDWRIGVGVIASFPAREVVISTLGTIFSLGSEVDEEDDGLIGTLQHATWPDGRPLFNTAVALSLMVFFALCAQCVSTLLIIRRETNSWRWPVVSFVYMTALAYVAALITYQSARIIS